MMKLEAVSQFKPVHFGNRNNSVDEKSNNNNFNITKKDVKYKLIPAAIALAAFTTAGTLDRDKRGSYREMNNFQNEYNEAMANTLEHIDENAAVFKLPEQRKDSIFRETKSYIYEQSNIVNDNEIIVNGHIKRKTDDKELVFKNKYTVDGELIERTIKNPKTGEEFYIDNSKDYFNVKDKDGNTVADEALLAIAAFLLAGGSAIYGARGLLLSRLRELRELRT